MAEEVQIAVYRDGALAYPVPSKGRETVLALSLDRLLATILKIPADRLEETQTVAEEALKKMSPYPDEPLKVSCERLSESESGAIVAAAALPESVADAMGDALDAAKASVRRVDVLAFGALRAFLGSSSAPVDASRRLVLIEDGPAIAAFVLDGATPVALRAISPGGDMRRETMLLLLEAEDVAGPAKLKEIFATDGIEADGIGGIAPVVRIAVPEEDAIAAVRERSFEPDAIDAIPESWSGVLDETRFKSKMKVWLSAAAAVWLAAVTVLAGVPKYREYRAGRYDTMRKTHRAAYRNVSERKAQVEAVRSVSNHDLGALETLRVVTSVLPEGVTLSKWNFKRGDRLSFGGTAENGNQQLVYDFKDGLAGVMLSQASGNDEDSETPFFTNVELPRGVVSRAGKAAFDVDCDFKTPEEEE